MPFDIAGARAAGYSDAEIADELAIDTKFDTAGARAAGYSDADIIAELEAPTSQPEPLEPLDSPERRQLVEQLQRRTTAADDAGRRLSSVEAQTAAARPVLQTLTNLADGVPLVSIPRLALNAGARGINRLAGTNIPQIPEITPQVLAPANDTEALTSGIARAAGAVTGGAAIGQGLSRLSTAGAQNVGRLLSSNLGLQTTAAAAGAGASELARRGGAGEIGQTAAGFAGGFIPTAALVTASKLATGLTRTPAAQRLLDAGVELTPGQLKSRGAVNQIEEGTQSLKIAGAPIAAGRQNARDTFQRVAVEGGSAPGTTIRQADPATMLDEAYQSYAPLYDQAKGFGAAPVIVNTNGPNVSLAAAVKRAIRAPSILATKDQRGSVLAFVEDQLTKGVRSSDDLLNIRSSIRDKARAARRSTGKEEQAELLDAADDVITRSIESQLSGSAAGNRALQALRTADASYGNYKTVEAAVARSKDRPGGFTPNDLSEAVAASGQGSRRGSYARGGGGPLRQLASDAREVLDARSPPTGARFLGATPLLAAPLDPVTALTAQGLFTGGVVAGAGTQAGRRLAAGTTGAQRFARQQLGRLNINTPQGYRQALAAGLIQSPDTLSPTAQIVGDMIGIPRGAAQSGEPGAEFEDQAPSVVFSDPSRTPQQIALLKSQLSKSDPNTYRALVRDFLGAEYANPDSPDDPDRIKAALPSGAPEILEGVIDIARSIPSTSPDNSPITENLRARAAAGVRFLVSPDDVDEAERGAGLDRLTDALLDPQARLKLSAIVSMKDPTRRAIALSGLLGPQAAASPARGLNENAGVTQ